MFRTRAKKGKPQPFAHLPHLAPYETELFQCWADCREGKTDAESATIEDVRAWLDVHGIESRPVRGDFLRAVLDLERSRRKMIAERTEAERAARERQRRAASPG